MLKNNNNRVLSRFYNVKNKEGVKMEKCVVCNNENYKEYFIGVSGVICKDCLIENCVYYALRSMGLIKEANK